MRAAGRVKSKAAVPRRLFYYLRTILRRKRGYAYEIDFDLLARLLGVCRRTIERAVATLRDQNAFDFLTYRVGRSYAVRVSDRHYSIRGVFLRRRKRIETPTPGENSGAAAPGGTASEPADSCPPTQPQAFCFEPRPGKIAALAAVLARAELADRHWDNCKITWRFPHAFCFARRALSTGHSVAAIVRAYDLALHQRHKDATDYALNRGCEPADWEPSSTVTLAAEKLRQDGRTVEQRWREFFTQPRRPAVEVKTSLPPARVPGAVEILRAKIAERPRDLPEVTLTQLARFLERRDLSLAEFSRFSWQMKQGYLEQCREFFRPDQPAQK